MDDGGKLDYTKNEGKGIVFNTQSFTQEEVNNMCKELKEKFNLHTWVGKNKNRHRTHTLHSKVCSPFG